MATDLFGGITINRVTLFGVIQSFGLEISLIFGTVASTLLIVFVVPILFQPDTRLRLRKGLQRTDPAEGSGLKEPSC